MSRICQITGKKAQRGKKVTRAWGVKYSSIRHRRVNLHKTTLLVDGIPVSVTVSSRGLKSVKKGKFPNVKTVAQALKDQKAAE